jgi:hypothetical protein
VIPRIAVLVLAAVALGATAQEKAPPPPAATAQGKTPSPPAATAQEKTPPPPAEPAVVEGFRWDLEIKNKATNVAKKYSFGEAKTFRLATSVGRCSLVLNPAQKGPPRFQTGAISCDDGSLAVGALAYCSDMASAHLTGASVLVRSVKKRDARSDTLTLKCANGVP